MSPIMADLDNLDVALRSEAAAEIAARRAAWEGMTARQKRHLTRSAVREYRKWLYQRQQADHGRQ